MGSIDTLGYTALGDSGEKSRMAGGGEHGATRSQGFDPSARTISHCRHLPFALSLSKGCLAVAREGFDKLSPNGFDARHIAPFGLRYRRPGAAAAEQASILQPERSRTAATFRSP